MPFTFQLIVGHKQLHQRRPQQFLVDVWLSNAISNHGPNQHESSCASLLAAYAKCLNSHKSGCALSKIISIAKPSDEENLVDRIFETSDAFNRRRLIVTFIKPNANIPFSNSEAEMHKAVSDSRERQLNDRIIDINPLLLLPFQEALMITPSLSLKFIVESLSEGARFDPTTFQAFALIVTLTYIVNFHLVDDFDLILHSEGAQAPSSALIVGYPSSKISFHFCNKCRIFCEGDQENASNGNDTEDDEVVHPRSQTYHRCFRWHQPSPSGNGLTGPISHIGCNSIIWQNQPHQLVGLVKSLVHWPYRHNRLRPHWLVCLVSLGSLVGLSINWPHQLRRNPRLIGLIGDISLIKLVKLIGRLGCLFLQESSGFL